jgi:hypothetical protein
VVNGPVVSVRMAASPLPIFGGTQTFSPAIFECAGVDAMPHAAPVDAPISPLTSDPAMLLSLICDQALPLPGSAPRTAIFEPAATKLPIRSARCDLADVSAPTLSADARRTATISTQFRSLGPVAIGIIVDRGAVTVSFTADESGTTRLLREAAPMLAATLRDQAAAATIVTEQRPDSRTATRTSRRRLPGEPAPSPTENDQ